VWRKGRRKEGIEFDVGVNTVVGEDVVLDLETKESAAGLPPPRPLGRGSRRATRGGISVLSSRSREAERKQSLGVKAEAEAGAWTMSLSSVLNYFLESRKVEAWDES
jgi:hypothetical protein